MRPNPAFRTPLEPGKLFLTEVASEKDYIATRVAYAMNLTGPAMTINSACSSGLVAIAQAAQSLLAGDSEYFYKSLKYC
jgi:acyl transferase domain-containing protein